MFQSIYSKIVLVVILAILTISCINQATFKEQPELNIGVATQKFKLDVSGNSLQSYVNVKLLSDTSRNLITQLGNYKFSTSIDPNNSLDNRYNPDIFIYYDYEGLQLKYTFKGGGMFSRKELQQKTEEFKKYVYLEEIIFEPKKYKGSLPKGLNSYSKSSDVEKILGKHNAYFDGGSSARKVNYTYPEYGLRFVFGLYEPAYITDDSTMLFITLSDSASEMKRYPTIYPKYSPSQR